MNKSTSAGRDQVQQALLASLRGGLIVSCQAGDDSPLYGPEFMAAFAKAAEMSGAVGLRVNGAADIQAVAQRTHLPIIGIDKARNDEWPVYITPTLESARSVVNAGATIVALDATHRPRPLGKTPEALISAIQEELSVLVMADVDSLHEGVAAAEAGADLVATTMAGYTPERPQIDGPDLLLIQELAEVIDVPIVCEGRIQTPSDARAALDAGAYAVVVGTAITNPLLMTQKFVQALER